MSLSLDEIKEKIFNLKYSGSEEQLLDPSQMIYRELSAAAGSIPVDKVIFSTESPTDLFCLTADVERLCLAQVDDDCISLISLIVPCVNLTALSPAARDAVFSSAA